MNNFYGMNKPNSPYDLAKKFLEDLGLGSEEKDYYVVLARHQEKKSDGNLHYV